MSEPELAYLSLFSYGSASLSKEAEIVYLPERIEIDTNQGVEIDGKVLAQGEDTTEKISYLGVVSHFTRMIKKICVLYLFKCNEPG